MAVTRKKTSFTISEEADKLLGKIAEKERRSKASMLEVLILDHATKAAITLGG